MCFLSIPEPSLIMISIAYPNDPFSDLWVIEENEDGKTTVGKVTGPDRVKVMKVVTPDARIAVTGKRRAHDASTTSSAMMSNADVFLLVDDM